MYCSVCGTQLAPGLSFCNRCGSSLKEPSDCQTTKAGAALLTAITVIALGGLGIMLGGAMEMHNEGRFGEELISVFMLMTFVLLTVVEVFLCRQLSRLSTRSAPRVINVAPSTHVNELRPAEPRTLPEPIPSVTENTTRTLEYSRAEATRR